MHVTNVMESPKFTRWTENAIALAPTARTARSVGSGRRARSRTVVHAVRAIPSPSPPRACPGAGPAQPPAHTSRFSPQKQANGLSLYAGTSTYPVRRYRRCACTCLGPVSRRATW